MHQPPHPADAGVQAVHHGVADRPRYRDNACAPQGAGAVDGEGRRGRSDAPDPQGVRIGRVARSTQRTLARDPKRCNRTLLNDAACAVWTALAASSKFGTGRRSCRRSARGSPPARAMRRSRRASSRPSASDTSSTLPRPMSQRRPFTTVRSIQPLRAARCHEQIQPAAIGVATWLSRGADGACRQGLVRMSSCRAHWLSLVYSHKLCGITQEVKRLCWTT